MSFFVYILRSRCSGRFYVGHTESIEKRLHEHNSDRVVATLGKGPWELLYSENFSTRSEAAQREMQIKQMKSRDWIERLVARASR